MMKKIKIGKKLTHMEDAFLCGTASIVKIKVAIGILDSHFMMGSMGSVVGEKGNQTYRICNKRKSPAHYFLCIRRCSYARGDTISYANE